MVLTVPVLFVQAQGTPPPTPLTLIAREGRRTVPTVIVSGQELIALDEVAMLFQVAVAEDAPTGSLISVGITSFGHSSPGQGQARA